MRKNSHIVSFCMFVLLMLGACKTKLTQFNISYETNLKQQFTTGKEVSFNSEEIKTDCRVKFERNDTKRSKVKRIHLKGLSFTGESLQHDMQQFKNLKNIYISSPSYAEQKIAAGKLNFQNKGNTLEIEIEDSKQDLIDFIKQDRFSMRFEFIKTPNFPEGRQLTVNIELFVEGELIKTNLYHKILV